MTTRRLSTSGEGSERRGLCDAPQHPERWLQTPTIPAQCLSISVTVHTAPGKDVLCYSIETTDPHTRELLGHVIEPTRRLLTAAQMASMISTDVRAVILALTDPEPF